MEILQSLGLVLGVGWTSGINLYATIAILGFSHNVGWIALPAGLLPIANESIILLAFVLYCIEFVIDKIPLADTTWDSFHTFIRPFGGAVIAYLATQGHGQSEQLIAAMIGGSAAFSSHATKATSRVLINTSPEPVSNWIASIGADVAVVIGLWATLQHPLVMIVFVTLFFIFSIWFVKKCFHLLKKIWKSFRNKSHSP